MKKIQIRLLPISSPTCQALIQEQVALKKQTNLDKLFSECKELLVIRLGQTLVAYGTFKLLGGQTISLNSLHFRDILAEHSIAQYWLSRYIKRQLNKQCYFNLCNA